MSFNTFYTSVFIYILSCSDKDVSSKTINENPELYKQIINKKKGYWTSIKTLGWLADGVWHSFSCFIGTYLLYSDITLKNDEIVTTSYVGICYFFGNILLFVTMIKNFLITSSFNYFSLFGIIFTFTFYLFDKYIVDFHINKDYLITPEYRTISFYLSSLLIVITSLLPDLAILYIKEIFYPSDNTIFQEIEYLEKQKLKKQKKSKKISDFNYSNNLLKSNNSKEKILSNEHTQNNNLYSDSKNEDNYNNNLLNQLEYEDYKNV
ncbi:hypothetical protein BCR36DRAFT_84587 [Piromyces finnis]|uniref:P-type ATPase C-terminal domain-containing protein n=1 Tax=Piromyces finnis TaxID=1754191 RepID=A0A1Y1V5J9_9FUNG|nr:hypothetical protein BCR36DRAFT_84587 [Piromyces finnis]|eukprot:ORX47826.1 hypothetical protein BCR36DRAFT_84587 [Piromyces finnis]